MLFIPLVTALVSAFAINVAADTQLIIQSESLWNFEGCTPEQQNQIYNAWNEAIDVATEANRWIGYSSHVKRDLFGGDNYVDDDSWNRIQGKDPTLRSEETSMLVGLVYYATTYGVAGKYNPFPT